MKLVLITLQANSYKDWFKYNWNDKAGGFDWDMVDIKLENLQADSVPLRFGFDYKLN